MRGQDAADCERAFAAGHAPERSPYGFHRAAAHGLDIRFSRDARSSVLRRMGGLSARLLGFDLPHALLNWRAIREANIIWTMTEGEAFAVATLFALRLAPRRPIIANSVWVVNDWPQIPWWRRALYRLLARHFSVLTVHSDACLEPARDALPDLPVRRVYFGINSDMFRHENRTESNGVPLRIFAAGNDRTRDWKTLLQAVGTDSRFSLKIACRWLTPEDVAPYPQAKLVREPGMVQFRALYAWADLVAIPMHENIFSGITVALEAAALGVPILSARTGAVPTYFRDDALFYYPPGDAAALRACAAAAGTQDRRARSAKAYATFIERDYSTDALIRRYVALSQHFAPGVFA